MKTIILLHGRKQRNSNDFSEIVPWFKEKGISNEIINLNWFDNYDLTTINDNHLLSLLEETASKVKNNEVEIIGYSTGGLLTPILKRMIKEFKGENTKITTYSVVPLVAELKNEQIKGYLENFFSKSELYLQNLKEECDSEEELKLKLEILKDKKSIDLNTRETYNWTRELLEKHRDKIINETNIHFLFSKSDFIIDTNKAVEILSKLGHDIHVDEFHHGLIFKDDNEIFKRWYESKK